MSRASPSYVVFVSNFTNGATVSDIFEALKREIESRLWPLSATVGQEVAGGFTIILPNMMQMQAVLAMNGCLIKNYPIWVVRFGFLLEVFTDLLRRVILANYSDGLVDLSRLQEKWNEEDRDGLSQGRDYVNMNNRDFVEFVLFTIGMLARDERIWVHSLVLSENGIEDVNPWARFFHFLPNLRYLNVMDNPLTQPTKLVFFPWIYVDEDPIASAQGGADPGSAQGPVPVQGEAPVPVQGQGFAPSQGQGQGQGFTPIPGFGQGFAPAQGQGFAPGQAQGQGFAPNPDQRPGSLPPQ